jgi:hypothetical protein
VNIQTHPRPNLRHVGTPMIAVLAEAISSATNPRISCAGADLYAGLGLSRRSGGPAIGSRWWRRK